MITALVVVLAAVLFFWLTGDKSEKTERPRGSAEQRDAEQKPGGREAGEEGKQAKEGKDGQKEQIPGWKRAMVRPRGGDTAEGNGAREPEPQERPVSPHVPGPPKR